MSSAMVCRRCGAGVVAMLLLLLIPPDVESAQVPANVRMQNVLKQFVQQTGHQVIGLGSWIAGTNYVPGSSDQDMRLLMPKGASDAAARESWNQSREVMRSLMQKEFGAEAEKMLAKTNLYPPSQLMNCVEDASDAARRYQALNAVPTLSHTGIVDAKTAAKYSEGLYGEGSKAWVQHYEQTKGKLFYAAENGKVYAGAADLAHMAEGQAKFSAQGMSHTATGWAELAAEDLKAGLPRDLAKHLDRMDRDLNKARELAGAGSNDAVRKELQSLAEELRGKSVDLTKLEGRIEQAMKAGRLEASILSRLEQAGPAEREMLETVLKDLRAGGSLSSKIMEAADKVPFGAIMDGLMLVMVAHDAGKTAGERSIAEAAVKAVPQLASLPVGLLSEIADKCLEGAKEGGAVMVANKQEATDLVAGIFTAQGREKGFERTAKMEYTIDDLVRDIHDHPGLEAFVRARADQAASREGGEALTDADKKVAEEIYNKDFPIILRLWENARDRYRREYIRLVNKMRTAPLTLSYEPDPATMPPDGKPLAVDVQASIADGAFYETKDRMRELIKILAGLQAYVYTSIQFKDKPRGDEAFTQTYEYKKPGSYPVSVTIDVSCNGTAISGENAGLKAEFKRTADITVVVLPYNGEPGVFEGWFNSDEGKIRFIIKGNVVSGQITGSGIEGGKLTGTYDPATKAVQATATFAFVHFWPDGRVMDRSNPPIKATLTGKWLTDTNPSKVCFWGNWIDGKGGMDREGRWIAKGTLPPNSAPPNATTTPTNPAPTPKK